MKKLFKNGRVILLIIFLIFSLVSIRPSPGAEGLTILGITPNSTAADSGIPLPKAGISPLLKERIVSVNGLPLASLAEYSSVENGLVVNTSVIIETNERVYRVLVPESKDLGLRLGEPPTSNIRKGLDLAGGTRVLLQPTEQVSQEDLELIVSSLEERLNIYGLSDIVVRQASDLAGQYFIVVEIAGLSEEEVTQLVSEQGKFEAKIGNETVFIGGKNDITYVCRSADCSGIDPQQGCGDYETGSSCRFSFSISLSPEAAQRQADITGALAVVNDQGQTYLEKDLDLYLDDQIVDTLRIGAELKGRATTDIQISGSGEGRTQQEAVQNSLTNMKRLQTIIITGSLPVTLDIVKVDALSPTLGKAFLDNAIQVGLLALLAVATIIFIRYRKFIVTIPLVITLLSEVILILGFAALVGWNLDLASLAGIIIVVGTGVDHLIIITDEILGGEVVHDWKKKIKNAMFIIMAAYFTTVVGMIPLWFAGAGLLKGFAFTTIAGISFGVLVVRPAYAAMLETLLQD
ncbi:MAG: hypothetical protein CMH61_01575 [Nanoarchaeota archaeon]|nr:hypothetical protein [Nanoarchaeota archaeon]|tara:strand:- start:661 stop:2217 length:1557 start_codon:yes stop_codon:yes gene_type:complete